MLKNKINILSNMSFYIKKKYIYESINYINSFSIHLDPLKTTSSTHKKAVVTLSQKLQKRQNMNKHEQQYNNNNNNHIHTHNYNNEQ